jgi:hypothetical protein
VDVFDALFDDEAPEARAAARPIAVQLCAACPSKCAEQVTEASAPLSSTAVVLTDEDVAGPVRCPRRSAVQFAQQAARDRAGRWQSDARARGRAHAAEAARLAAQGLGVREIARRLDVPVEAARTLLRLTDRPAA